ncbi:MAG: recombination protein O N-terminal domain-containing protein [Treponema sp.]|jgi:DNA repair protein RecO (recombination protein O)|nr:recombination protein O N-terminal domain-containing protein [Treponema sp.]
MQRSFSSPALVLRVRPSGESNREACFLTAAEGLVTATLFGGPKSRLRSHVSPFNSGLLFSYRDPAKDFRKVSDFDVRSWRPGLRELYERSDTASGIAAALLAGHGGGGAWVEALAMADASLDALEDAGEECCLRILLHFLWNWAALLGRRSDPGFCGSCGDSAAALLWFVPGEGFLCGSCMRQAGGGSFSGAVLGPGARRWLLAVEGLPPSELARYSLDAPSRGELTAFLSCLRPG